MGSGSGLVVVECDGRDVKGRRFVVHVGLKELWNLSGASATELIAPQVASFLRL